MALGIIGILGKSKEKDTLDLMKKHIEKIVETKDAYKEAYTLFKANKKKKAEMMANTVSEKEHDADLICKRIVVNLYEGAFMPNMRSNIYRTVEEIDTVADKIKNAANMIPFLKVVKLNNVLKDILDELAEHIYTCVDHLQDTFSAFLQDDDTGFKKHVETMKIIEEKADRAQKLMYQELLFKKHDVKTLHIVSAFGHFMAAVTDAADNSCDIMELLRITTQN